MEERHKRERLYAIAEQDPIYQVWKHCYEDAMMPFKDFLHKQPEEVQDFLSGYADGGRLMMQKIINIACANMEFIEDEKM